MDVNQLWSNLQHKVSLMADHLKDSSPCDYKNGKWNDMSHKVFMWTHTFWCGILWTMYAENQDPAYKKYAQSIEARMDNAFVSYDEIHHDAGFVWLLSSVMDYEQTGNEQSRKRAMLAASVLASRFHLRGQFIRAWNAAEAGWAIIDCMMNIPLLFWASKQIDDQRFADIARAHADTVMKTFIREDGSVRHIVEFDTETGEMVTDYAGQGCAKGSSWSRGQSWALYGFTQCYRWTGDVRYLNTAKKVAHYFIASICDTWIPKCDFRQPADCTLTDTSAGSVAASALVDLAGLVEEGERDLYLNAAKNILFTFADKCADFTAGDTPILSGACRAYSDQEQVGLIYADYYYVEAVNKLRSFPQR